MRHEDDGAAVAEQELFEPGDGLDVEVIRRLIEQQDVGLSHERPRQQDAPPPAAGQRVHDRGAIELQP